MLQYVLREKSKGTNKIRDQYCCERLTCGRKYLLCTQACALDMHVLKTGESVISLHLTRAAWAAFASEKGDSTVE